MSYILLSEYSEESNWLKKPSYKYRIHHLATHELKMAAKARVSRHLLTAKLSPLDGPTEASEIYRSLYCSALFCGCAQTLAESTYSNKICFKDFLLLR